VVTSVDPLRTYVFNGKSMQSQDISFNFPAKEYQLRFCPLPYHPFKESELDRYVVSANYKHVWQVNIQSGICLLVADIVR